MGQGKALTPMEKRDRIEAKRAELAAAASQTAPTQTPVATPVEQVRAEHQREEPQAQRRQRGVFNGTTSKFTIRHTIPGYHLHVLNDYPGRVENALLNGYEYVTPEEVGIAHGTNTDVVTNRVRYLVGTHEGGDPMYGYLMKIRQEWYDEDQADIQNRVTQVDDAIRHGRNGQPDNFYIPKDGIKVSS